MMDVARLQSELIRDEGLKLKPYRCTAGRLTIGVGRNLDDRGIDEDEALYLLRRDTDAVIAQLDKALPWWRKLSDARQRALVNMAFNLGINGLLQFKTTLRLLEAGEYDAASQAMLVSKWATQVGERAKRLSEMVRLG